MDRTCSKCGKDITHDYYKLKYKILDSKGKKIFFKGELCRKCLEKEENKLAKAEVIYQVDESIHLHSKPKKKRRRYYPVPW